MYQDFESSYTDLLRREGSQTLHLGRLKNIAIETFKILNDQSPMYLSDFVHAKQSSYSFRYQNVLDTRRFRTVGYGRNSFRYIAPTIWNSLPQEMRLAVSLKDFRKLLSTWNGIECRCSLCKF